MIPVDTAEMLRMLLSTLNYPGYRTDEQVDALERTGHIFIATQRNVVRAQVYRTTFKVQVCHANTMLADIELIHAGDAWYLRNLGVNQKELEMHPEYIRHLWLLNRKAGYLISTLLQHEGRCEREAILLLSAFQQIDARKPHLVLKHPVS